MHSTPMMVLRVDRYGKPFWWMGQRLMYLYIAAMKFDKANCPGLRCSSRLTAFGIQNAIALGGEAFQVDINSRAL